MQNQENNYLYIPLINRYNFGIREYFYIPDNENYRNDILDIHIKLPFNNMSKLKKLAQKCNINNYTKLHKYELIDKIESKIIFEQ